MEHLAPPFTQQWWSLQAVEGEENPAGCPTFGGQTERLTG